MKKDTPKLIKAILAIGYEPIEPDAVGEGAQIVDGQWYMPRWGCDTLQHVIEIIEQLPIETIKQLYVE